MDEKSIIALCSEMLARNEAGALCTVIASSGSTPRHVGSKMLVYENGTFIGSVGGGELEHRVLDEAWIAIAEGKPTTVKYSMVDPKQGDPGVCGGTVEVFVDPILPPPTLVVIGAGHVGKAVAHLAKWLGFSVAVCDDRTEFCTSEANPDADIFFPIRMEELPGQLKINRQTYLVLTTRGVSVDVPGIPPLLETNAAYIGLIGSKRRWLTTVKQMQENGVPAEKIARIHSPIGLELRAETPEEIAVSIMAEIIMIRNGGSGEQMSKK